MNTQAFYPELGRLFPTVPWVTFDYALSIAARTLCQLGLVWRKDLEPVSWEAGTFEYQLISPNEATLVQLLDAGGLTATTPQQLRRRSKYWAAQQGSPEYYYPLPENRIRVAPIPMLDEDEVFIPHAALSPVGTVTTLDDAFAIPYERLLFQGAAAHLGAGDWQVYERDCHRARSRATDMNHVGVPRTVRYGGI